MNIRVDKDFNDKQSLKVWYNFKQGRDGYPIATPNLKYWNEKDWKDIIFKAAVGQLDENNKLVGGPLSGDSRNPGYHNLYALDGAVYGSFSKFKNNDWDINIPLIKTMAWKALSVFMIKTIAMHTEINIDGALIAIK